MSKKLVITGGCGFIGSSFLKSTSLTAFLIISATLKYLLDFCLVLFTITKIELLLQRYKLQ